MKKIYIALGIALTLLGAGCTKEATNNNAANLNAANAAVTTITYGGKEGEAALDILKASHTVKSSTEGFVTAIDGVEAGNKQYWAFYVNDKMASVGAADYVTKSGDEIKWVLESY